MGWSQNDLSLGKNRSTVRPLAIFRGFTLPEWVAYAAETWSGNNDEATVTEWFHESRREQAAANERLDGAWPIAATASDRSLASPRIILH